MNLKEKITKWLNAEKHKNIKHKKIINFLYSILITVSYFYGILFMILYFIDRSKRMYIIYFLVYIIIGIGAYFYLNEHIKEDETGRYRPTTIKS